MVPQYLESEVDEQNRFSVREGEVKDKFNYRELSKFIIRFDTTSNPLAGK
jgi:hypothetical protein